MKNNSFAWFTRACFIFKHFADVLVVSTTWNGLFCSCVEDVRMWWQLLNFASLFLKRWGFSKDPATYRARKAILETMIRWPWKPALLLCLRYKERQTNCQVSKIGTWSYWRCKGIYDTQKFWDIRETGPWFQFYSRIIRSHFASVRTLNNIKMIVETRSNIFRWRSRCGRRRLCLSSLLPRLTTPSKAMC